MEQIHGLRERGKAWKDFNERAEFRRDMNKNNTKSTMLKGK